MFELRVLSWVRTGEVSTGEGGYVHHGRLIAGDMAAGLTRLMLGGYLMLASPGQDKRRAVAITEAGLTRLAALERGGDRRG